MVTMRGARTLPMQTKSFPTTALAFACLTSLVLLVASCGSSGHPASHGNNVAGVRTAAGALGTFHAGALPTPHGTLTVTAPSTGSAINGGSTQVTIVATAEIIKVYVAVDGQDGYWEITLPAGSTVADLLLTLAQVLPNSVTIIFEVADAAGNISEPVRMTTSITQVG